MKNATCPKCESEDVKTTWVPLGHGRYNHYACPECRIIFEWGYNKFGNIESVDQIRRIKPLQEDEDIEEVTKGLGDWKKI